MEINYFIAHDATKIIPLHKLIFKEDNPQFFKNLQTKDYYKIFVASQNNTAIAYCIVSLIADDAEIINIGVDPKYRRKHIAENLLKFALQKLDFSSMFLEVSKNNIAAIELYKKCGFIPYSTRKDYYGKNDDAILMKIQKN